MCKEPDGLLPTVTMQSALHANNVHDRTDEGTTLAQTRTKRKLQRAAARNSHNEVGSTSRTANHCCTSDSSSDRLTAHVGCIHWMNGCTRSCCESCGIAAEHLEKLMLLYMLAKTILQIKYEACHSQGHLATQYRPSKQDWWRRPRSLPVYSWRWYPQPLTVRR